MNSEFKNKWVLVLGGSSGLGLASAKKLAAHGMHLILVYRERKAPEEALVAEMTEIHKSGIKTVLINDNALDKDSRKNIIDKIKMELGNEKIYCLLHSIAKGNLKSLGTPDQPQATKEDFDITLHAMATSWWEWTSGLVAANLFAGDSRNISFTSEGNKKFIPNYGVVAAAKATLESMARYMAVELASVGIKTNIIQSGVVETPSLKMIPDSEKIIELTQKRNPFKRLTKTEDIANVVYLLCKDEGKWINGAVICADGGESLL